MADNLILVSLGYALLTAAIGAYEARRTRPHGPDVLSVFMAVYLLQCCVPGVVIYGCLSFVGLDRPTGNPVFDRIFAATDLPSSLLVLGLTACFVPFFYIFAELGGVAMRRLLPAAPGRSWLLLYGSAPRILSVLMVGLALTLLGFWVMGDTLVERYANMILLRGSSDEVEASKLNAFSFLLTQSWLWLSIATLFVFYERRGRDLAWYFCLVCAVIFAILAVSRRAIFIPLLLAYFTLVLFDGRWRMKWLLAASIPILLWVAFGKEVLSAVAYGGTVESVTTEYATPAAGILRTASEVGITVVESVGTVTLLDLQPRFGVDHLLSLLHGDPIGWILHRTGQDEYLPVRIVRLSTEAFATSESQDVPPGIFGQMWVDFRILGPIVWAFLFAAQLSIVKRILELVVRTRQAMAALVLLTFVIALPLNSGSYDFTFSIDIIALSLFLLWTFKIARLELNGTAEGNSASAGS